MNEKRPTEQAVFESARSIGDRAARAAYVEEACGGDAALRQRVARLLKALDDDGSFLETPPTAVGAAADTARKAVAQRPQLGFLLPANEPGVLGRLGHYSILEIVGSGGFGVVLKARDEKLQRIVAVKVLAETLAASGAARQRFVREAVAAAAVRHENVVSIYAVDDAGPVPYLVMEYIEGQSLEQRLQAAGALELKEILRIGTQMAAGLAAAHKQGIVHRDVKPANILLENGVQRVKITDFGLARATDDASLTASGAIAGTPSYMSPEQARGDAVDHRSDLFSLGSVLYAMCTGRPPFRAENTIGVLKRVCEEEARLIQQVNADVPEWLSAIVHKLHAKLPEERFQSADEVSTLLGRYLAGLQQPLPLSLADIRIEPRNAAHTRAEAGGSWHGPWFAAALACAAAGILLVAAWAGGYLPPRSQTQSDAKDDAPSSLPAQPVAPAASEAGAFVILGGQGGDERQFATLAEAVSAAGEGETIEIRGDGPFEAESIDVRRPLTIRAAAGAHPRFLASSRGPGAIAMFLHVHEPLTLEGLDFREAQGERFPFVFVNARAAPLRIANCRFERRHPGALIQALMGPVEIRNCLLIEGDFNAALQNVATGRDGSTIHLENNVFVSPSRSVIQSVPRPGQTYSYVVRRNTFVTVAVVGLGMPLSASQASSQAAAAAPKRVRLDAAENVFAARWSLLATNVLGPAHEASTRRFVEDCERQWLEMFAWRDQRNVYPADLQFRVLQVGQPLAGQTEIRTLDEWLALWGASETGSVQGPILFAGGDVVLSSAQRESLDPKDFRLKSESVGKGAAADGGDLGANIDLVGPGKAYERWKETPEYGEWLRATSQLAENERTQPFVVLGGQGAFERKFDTLSDALLRARSGETVEIRGDGPYVVGPLEIRDRALVLRAGKGCRPVVQLDGGRPGPLLTTNSPLVLEGIEFVRQADADSPLEPNFASIVVAYNCDLHVANCKFLREIPFPGAGVFCNGSARAVIRNSQFVHGKGGAGIGYAPSDSGNVLIDNCTDAGFHSGLALMFDAARVQHFSVALRDCTWSTHTAIHVMAKGVSLPSEQPQQTPRLVSVETTGNVFDIRNHLLVFRQTDDAPSTHSTETLTEFIRGTHTWRDADSLYPQQLSVGVRLSDASDVSVVTERANWDRFWNVPPPGWRTGAFHFHGGDPYAVAGAAGPELRTEDFRLTEDSAGYRAGPEGKDLGADIDFVGPGAAYERWKGTPKYQEWLNQTGQKKQL